MPDTSASARNVPAAELAAQADGLKKWRDKTVITYDDSGTGGAGAARTLTTLGLHQGVQPAGRGERLGQGQSAADKDGGGR